MSLLVKHADSLLNLAIGAPRDPFVLQVALWQAGGSASPYPLARDVAQTLQRRITSAWPAVEVSVVADPSLKTRLPGRIAQGLASLVHAPAPPAPLPPSAPDSSTAAQRHRPPRIELIELPPLPRRQEGELAAEAAERGIAGWRLVAYDALLLVYSLRLGSLETAVLRHAAANGLLSRVFVVHAQSDLIYGDKHSPAGGTQPGEGEQSGRSQPPSFGEWCACVRDATYQEMVRNGLPSAALPPMYFLPIGGDASATVARRDGGVDADLQALSQRCVDALRAALVAGRQDPAAVDWPPTVTWLRGGETAVVNSKPPLLASSAAARLPTAGIAATQAVVAAPSGASARLVAAAAAAPAATPAAGLMPWSQNRYANYDTPEAVLSNETSVASANRSSWGAAPTERRASAAHHDGDDNDAGTDGGELGVAGALV
jgi:hypothetical protein